MNADHYFTIGKDHETCEDYALSGVEDNFAYAIVCDGCSSSPDVDLGARVLAVSAREALHDWRSTPMNYDIFGKVIVKKADLISAIFPRVDPEFLDATLLIASVDQGKLTAVMYGDGMFFHKTANALRAIHVEFNMMMDGVNRGAPAYLSYHLEDLRKERYDELEGHKAIYDGLMSGSTWGGTSVAKKPFDPIIIEAPVAPGDVIAVCSDGINSFRRPDDTKVEWMELASEYMGFKTLEGVFVRRRMAAFQRKCQKQLMTHSDDLSIAAITI